MKIIPFEPTEDEAEDSVECSGGFGSHDWTLSIEAGCIDLESGCETCNNLLMEVGPHSDALELDPIPVEIVFDPECDNLGGWHGDVRCDCGWTYRATPKPKPELYDWCACCGGNIWSPECCQNLAAEQNQERLVEMIASALKARNRTAEAGPEAES